MSTVYLPFQSSEDTLKVLSPYTAVAVDLGMGCLGLITFMEVVRDINKM